jgi:hypothetical protein
VRSIAPILKACFVALKVAANAYGVPIPALGLQSQCTFDAIGNASPLLSDVQTLAGALGADIELSEVFDDSLGNQVTEDALQNGASTAISLSMPPQLKGEVAQAVSKIFPAAVCAVGVSCAFGVASAFLLAL